MPSASNATRKTASSGRSVNVLHGNEIAAGARSMKRMKRGADSSQESSSQEGFENKKRFVGVRQRPSGRWVAEIKDTTQKIRLWLGTFDSAEEGAKAYDSAARALRGANTRTNFVTATASSCDATVLTKAASLIRLRQTAATASSKACASFSELCCGSKQSIRPDLIQSGSGNRDAPSQEDSIFASETLSCAKNHGREEDSSLDHSRLSCHDDDASASAPPFSDSNTAPFVDSNIAPFSGSNIALPAYEGAKLQPSPSPSPSPLPSPSPSPSPSSTPSASTSASPSRPLSMSPSPWPLERESFPCATNRADEEAGSSADDNEAMLMNTENDIHGISTCQDDAESRSFSHEEQSRSTDEDDQRDRGDVIPWPDYVLMDELDLSCEETSTTGVYPAFEFSEEAMDRDSEHYLSDDSSDFLLRLQQHSSSCPAQCEIIGVGDELLLRPPASPGSINSGECSSLVDQALWSSMDLVSLCMVS